MNSHVKGGDGKIRIDTVRKGVANELFGAKILNNGQIQPALVDRNVAKILIRIIIIQ